MTQERTSRLLAISPHHYITSSLTILVFPLFPFRVAEENILVLFGELFQ